jgi:hypothetical protein
LTLLAVSSAFAQDVPPPPKPADDGPSLEVTMKYIQDRLNGQAKVSYQSYLTDDNDPSSRILSSYSSAVSNTAADTAGCKLSFTIDTTAALPEGKTYIYQYLEKLSVRDIDRLVVESEQDIQNRRLNDLNRQTGQRLHFEFNPPIFLLRVMLNSGKTINIHARTIDDHGAITEVNVDSKDSGVYSLPFLEEGAAQRMAKAMVHAVELCGGGDKDLFK